ncbi:hypothetical protein [Actinosynnema sp. ALI-1.44]|uniref:hypothetical protein n=1 Tax=Actinosynnema sp. ALI-1.44 TaxID=1933779 RepID=UPI001EDC2FDD|nr:hypothetical protein [Actinosynnema sp. ALI-1.44]
MTAGGRITTAASARYSDASWAVISMQRPRFIEDNSKVDAWARNAVRSRSTSSRCLVRCSSVASSSHHATASPSRVACAWKWRPATSPSACWLVFSRCALASHDGTTSASAMPGRAVVKTSSAASLSSSTSPCSSTTSTGEGAARMTEPYSASASRVDRSSNVLTPKPALTFRRDRFRRYPDPQR